MKVVPPLARQKNGLTFIEVMVTIVIVSFGVVAIFKSYRISLEQMNHLTNRIYATQLLDHQVASIEQGLRGKKVLPFELNQTESINVGPKTIDFQKSMSIDSIDPFVDIFALEVTISWKEGKREFQLTRATYISDYYNTAQN